MHSLARIVACVFVSIPLIAAAAERDYPFAPVPFTAVHVQDGFWSPRMETNRTVTVWYDFQKCEETGRIDNFAKAAGQMPGEFRGIPFDDSDVYKVIEGAAYVLAMQPDEKLDHYLDALIAKIAAAQEPDGYLYTARRLFTPEKMPSMSGKTRWSNLGSSHELYNVGHLYEAAVAHFQATGKRTLLDVATKNADMLCATFAPGKLQEPPGHEEIEIGLVKLYRVTGQEKYLKLAQFFIDIRGRADTHALRGAGQQDHQPIVDQAEAVGHAVRAGYLYSGVADVAAITGREDYLKAIDRIWEDVVSRKLHLTGGIGASPGGEAFGAAYELPNRSAYLETCAAIANALWNQRMFLLHGDGRYVDVLERVVYNGFLSGISLSGDRFFYPNPLETDGLSQFNHGSSQRAPWFGCSCCPVNVVRFIPSIAGYVYATRGDDLYVNLFVGGTGSVKLASGDVKVTQETNYPWDGKVSIGLQTEKPREFTVRVRVPGWARNEPVPSDLYRFADECKEAVSLSVNGEPVRTELDKGFAVIRREWKSGDKVEMNIPMPVRRIVAHDKVEADRDRVAIQRGPLVYCAEGADNDGHVLNFVLSGEPKFRTEHCADLLGGVTRISAGGQARRRGEDGQALLDAAEIRLIPYYAWNHRGANEMQVWLPVKADLAQIAPLPTVASGSRATASHANPPDSPKSMQDQVEPKNSGDHDLPRFTWWDHRGTKEWVQYDFAAETRVKGIEVYWFDDSGRGQCRVPQSFEVLYKDGDAWKPVQPGEPVVVKKDAFNRVLFAPVKCQGLRLQVQLQPEFSGGVLEWRVLSDG